MLSVVGDVLVDSGAPVVTSSISKICRLSLSEVLVGIGLRACTYKDECACVFVNVCVCAVFLKKETYTSLGRNFIINLLMFEIGANRINGLDQTIVSMRLSYRLV